MSLQGTYTPKAKDLEPVSAVQRELITPLAIHKRSCSLEKDFDPLANKSKQICISLEEKEYSRILGDVTAFRQYLDDMIEQYPELFPAMIQQGYTLHDILPESEKMPGIRLRRIYHAHPTSTRAHPRPRPLSADAPEFIRMGHGGGWMPEHNAT